MIESLSDRPIVLVVGGAGYIGSHTCLDLSEKGFAPVVYDNLSKGHEEFVRWGPLERGDLLDTDRLVQVIMKYKPRVILHFAALIEVGDSLRNPLNFYHNNVSGTISLLRAAYQCGVDNFVFSSTCATYGIPNEMPMTEVHRQVPVNPYGRGKLMVEQILADLGACIGVKSVILRYFNAAGADLRGRIGEWHEPETHALPLAIASALGHRGPFNVFGSDYDTRDGTCLRDYVHVMDLADAHSRAVSYLIAGGESVSLNLGTGIGTTVRELLSEIGRVSGRDIPFTYENRRPGDSPALVADNQEAKRVLGWTPKHDLRSVVETAWQWHSNRPETFSNRSGF